MTSVGEVQTTEAFRFFLPSSSPVSPKKSPGPKLAITRGSLPPSAPATSTWSGFGFGSGSGFGFGFGFGVRGSGFGVRGSGFGFGLAFGVGLGLGFALSPRTSRA
jgi:hypothetical protein